MELKRCPGCQRTLSRDKYGIHRKEPCGLFYICKECRSKSRLGKRAGERCKKRSVKELTLREYLSNKYMVIRHRITEKAAYNNKKIEFTREEFIEFGLNDKNYLSLHKEWAKSGHQYNLIPTVDRIDKGGNYSLDNIQFLTMLENTRKH